MATASKFKVIRDGDEWMVVDATIGAYSFAMVAVGYCASKAEATEEMRKLQGRTVEVWMVHTPDRFEDVADRVYGPAWE